MTLPPRYNKILQRTYSDCRMRWSESREEWHLERRANYTRLDIDPAHYPASAVDTFIRHRDGYYLAGSFAPRNLPPVDRLVAFLLAHDPVKLGYGPGDGDRLADEIEAREAAREAQAYGSTRREFVESGADVLHDANVTRSVVPRYEFGCVRPGGLIPIDEAAHTGNGHECGPGFDKGSLRGEPCDDPLHQERVALENAVNSAVWEDFTADPKPPHLQSATEA